MQPGGARWSRLGGPKWSRHSQVAGRFAWHDLLRLCAIELADRGESDAENRAATGRMLDHYLHTACGADRLLDPARAPLDLPAPQPGTMPQAFTDREHALAWFEAERPALLAAVRKAATMGFDTHAWQIPWSLASFLQFRGYWREMADTQRTALAAAERLGDLEGQARSHRCLGLARFFRRRPCPDATCPYHLAPAMRSNDGRLRATQYRLDFRLRPSL